jgi:prepilin-type N-terminal cleavage/methylation domain-containing protein
MARNSTTAGFTLIEVLLAMGITAIVMTTVTMSFQLILEARESVDSLAESTEAGPRILNLLERDIRGLWTFNVKNNAVLRGRFLDVASFEADRIDLLTTTDSVGYVLDGMNQQRRPTMCEVGYWLKQNPRYRDLIELWRREDPMVDQDLLTGGTFQLVHDRLKNFKISYYKTLGNEAEELHEWDSAENDELPRRIKIEFTIERQRSSHNVVSDAEIDDFEGAEKTYVRHIVLDRRYPEILRAGVALVPVAPPPPQDAQGGPGAGGGPMGPGGASMSGLGRGGNRGPGGRGGPGGPGGRGGPGGEAPGTRQAAPPGARGGNGTPGNGFNLGDILRGGTPGTPGNIFGTGGRGR